MTFSIVAADPASGQLGVAVQSKFLAVGSIVPWARAEVGAVATQAFCDVMFGPRGLAALERGLDPEAVLEELLAGDPEREKRQVGIVAADGRAASFTGAECFDHASSWTRPGYAAQGNILAGPAVVEALASTFESRANLPLPERLLAALEAAQAAGGDRRGQESAALVVVKPGGGYGGNHDRWIDLRADDHPRPIEELARLLELHRLYFDRPAEQDLIAIDDTVRTELTRLIEHSGHAPQGTPFGEALFAYVGWENLEERFVDETRIDPIVLRYIREHEGHEGGTR
jgi:uncharacterized Ntn-hydrolase superfamily protein